MGLRPEDVQAKPYYWAGNVIKQDLASEDGALQ